MQRKTIISILMGFLLLLVALAQYYVQSQPYRTQTSVTRVIDGDTIVIEGGERVRLLDIDTPERGQLCSINATKRLEELIDGREIVLEKRGEDRDVYDRLLRYVFVDDVLINLVMVREGWANLYVVDKGPYYPLFLEAEQAAKKDGLCVWGK